MAIITEVPFPNGYAPVNRIMTYSKGLISNGVDCEVMVVCPNKMVSNRLVMPSGEVDGISYSYPGKVVFYHKNLIARKIQYYYALAASLIYSFFNYFLYRKVDLIIYYGNQPFFECFLVILSKIFKQRLFKEQSENPYLFFKSGRIIPPKFLEMIYIRFIFRNYTGILVMTKKLKQLFIDNGISENKLVVVNNTVFKYNLPPFPKNEIYFAYSGSLNQKKDGVITIIEAFREVIVKYPDAKLKIAGFGTDSEIKAVFNKIKELKINNNVTYLGALSSVENAQLICNASVLLSARPNSIQAEYGFPTKIIEYLATGNPLITTITGELGLYLQHRKNAFIVSDNVKEIASICKFVLKDLTLAEKTGREGLELVEHEFNPVLETRKIISFYFSLK